jgi:hypothetical protein
VLRFKPRVTKSFSSGRGSLATTVHRWRRSTLERRLVREEQVTGL